MLSHQDVTINTSDDNDQTKIHSASTDAIVIDLTSHHEDSPATSQVLKIEIVDGVVDPEKAVSIGCFQISKAALIPALLAAGVEVADVMTSLIGAKRSFAIIIPASITAYLASFGLTGHPTEQAFGEICGIIRNRGLPNNRPEDWPQLSYYQELGAIIVTATLGSWGTFSKFTWAYYILNTIPGDYALVDNMFWKMGSFVCASGFTLTGLLTETYDSYKLIRKWLVSDKATYSNRLGKVFGLGLGIPFGVVNASMDSTQAITTISDTYKIKGNPGFWMIAAPAILFDGGQKLAFEGRTVINSIYDFTKHVQNLFAGAKNLDRDVTIAFSISLAMSIFLEFSKQPINYGFYLSEAGDFNINANNKTTSTLLLALSWLAFVGGILIGTPSLYPEVKTAVHWSGNKLCAAKNKLGGHWSSFWQSCRGSEEQPLLVKVEEVDVEAAPAMKDQKTPSYRTF